MTKKITLLLTCIALVAMGMAQQKVESAFGKLSKERITERSLEKLKPTTPQAKLLLPPQQNTPPKGTDWYEPDTVYIFVAEHADPIQRNIRLYDEKGNCILLLEQYFHLGLGSWVDEYKTIYTFDEYNNRVRVVSYQNQGGKLEFNWQITCTYDTQNNRTQEIYQRWESGQWVNQDKQNLVYDGQNNMLEYTYFYWEDVGAWKCTMKNVYAYDAQNNLIEEINQSTTMYSNELQNLWKNRYTYDIHNSLIENLIYSWKSEEWMVFSKAIYTYDAQNNMIEQCSFDWESEQWVASLKLNCSYDMHNNVIERKMQSKNWETEELVNTWKEKYTYNTQNNLTEFLNYSWESEEWMLDKKITSSYDVQSRLIEEKCEEKEWGSERWFIEHLATWTFDLTNNLIEETYQQWDWDLWQLGNLCKNTYDYDEHNNAISGICKIFIDNKWVDVNFELTMYYNNMQADLGYYKISKVTTTYIKTGKLSIQENRFDNTVKLYPNPVSDVLNIETGNEITPNVKIYSMQGALLMNVTGNTINLSSFPTGIYIAEINGKSHKIVKQ